MQFAYPGFFQFLLFLLLAVSALGANPVLIERDAAEGAAVNLLAGVELGAGGIHATGEGEFGNVEFVLEQVIDNLDHALDGHRLLGHHEAGVAAAGRLRGESARGRNS